MQNPIRGCVVRSEPGIAQSINKAVPCCDFKTQSRQRHRQCLWGDVVG